MGSGQGSYYGQHRKHGADIQAATGRVPADSSGTRRPCAGGPPGITTSPHPPRHHCR
ncbi:hypothetical protein ACH4U6_36150 [Streptomyces netropsis]|uniref:hypothetical protein n=1 Tax=Streptomyces netropsis TaxID=55404 RepID=UPI0037B7D2F7